MPAFAGAVELGYRYVETDVHVTADDVVVAFHDPDLQRTCGRPGRIEDLTWEQLRQARVAGVAPIPRLADLLEEWPDLRVNIDCKSDRAAEPLALELERTASMDRVCVASFSDARLRRLRRRLGPGLCSAAGPQELAYLWLTGRRPASALTVQVPPRHGRLTLVGTRFVRRVHRAGLALHVWTIDDPMEMARLLDLGVDGIMTDRPAVLRDVLQARSEWPAA